MRSLRAGRAKCGTIKKGNVLTIYYVPGTHSALSKTISDQSNNLADVDIIPVLQKKRTDEAESLGPVSLSCQAAKPEFKLQGRLAPELSL